MIESPYTVKIAKAAAVIADSKALLEAWDLNSDVTENLDRIRHTNVFGDASRARAADVLRVFRQRYFDDPEIGRALAILVKGHVPGQWIDPLLYFYTAMNDATLHDLVLSVIDSRQKSGYQGVTVDQVMQQLREWVSEGKTAGSWTDKTVRIVAQHALAALRDFGILQGKVIKSITPIYLPVEPFAVIAFELWRRLGSGEKVLRSPEWGLFFLPTQGVERFFFEAHQERLLSYDAAGSVIRLEFPVKSLEEMAHGLVERSRS
jgi:hypothetical protein